MCRADIQIFVFVRTQTYTPPNISVYRGSEHCDLMCPWPQPRHITVLAYKETGAERTAVEMPKIETEEMRTEKKSYVIGAIETIVKVVLV